MPLPVLRAETAAGENKRAAGGMWKARLLLLLLGNAWLWLSAAAAGEHCPGVMCDGGGWLGRSGDPLPTTGPGPGVAQGSAGEP